jgi:hypothetical protein
VLTPALDNTQFDPDKPLMADQAEVDASGDVAFASVRVLCVRGRWCCYRASLQVVDEMK